MNYRLEYTELAIKMDSGYSFPFKDKDVHSVLMNSGVHKVQPNGSTGEEWFDKMMAGAKISRRFSIRDILNMTITMKENQRILPIHLTRKLTLMHIFIKKIF